MVTLQNFYKTKEWRKLVELLKLERLNDRGEIVCEYCGKPIIKAYDCIGHHKIELTPQNVNDTDISLNSDNVALVHHSCHNKIHNKLGHFEQTVWLVYGSPLSGKTTYVKSVCMQGDLIIDIDNIWQSISGCDRYIKPDRLKPVVFALRDKLIECAKYRLGNWKNCYIIGGYPLIGERERLVKSLGARELFIDTSKEVCYERLNALNNRPKAEWIKYIDEWFRQYHPPT